MDGSSRLGENPLEWIKKSISNKEKNKRSTQSGISKQKTVKASKIGLKKGWTRATFVIEESVFEKAKDLAYWDRKKLKDVINDALLSHFSDKNIKPRP